MKCLRFITAAFLCFGWTNAFSQYATGACNLIPNSKNCVDTTPCKDIGGKVACLAGVPLPGGAISVPQSCWQYSYDFACASTLVNTCTLFETNKACEIVSSKCTDTTPENGQCNSYNNIYSCMTKAETKEQKLSCSSGVFNSDSMTDPVNTNNSFQKAALAQEILRQSATYGANGLNIFAGVAETCTKGYFGIKNCCKSTPGATSNSVMMNVALSGAASAVKYAGQLAVDAASPYVYDAMYKGGQYASGLAANFSESAAASIADFSSAAPTSTTFAAGGPSLSAYGFTYQSGIAAQGSGFMGANSTLATFGEGSSMTSVTFNPYVFGAMVAIQVIQSLRSCTQDEQMLALHKGANLSTFVREVCTKKIPIIGTCIEWTSTYCSFNSVLARLINMQGKPQLGLDTSNCQGISVAQMSQIDFTKIDFGDFVGQMTQQATKNMPTNISGNYNPIMQKQTSGTSQGKSANLPNYSQ